MIFKHRYFQLSKTPLYGLLSAIPLLVIYEIMAFSLSRDADWYIRNHADIIFKNFVQMFGLHGPLALCFIAIIVVTIAYLLQEKKIQIWNFKFFILIILEGAIYAAFIGAILSFFIGALLLSASINKELEVSLMLAFGAGVYEELIFRVLLFSITGYTLIQLFSAERKIAAYTVAAIFSSISFAWVHYLGEETFTFYSALYRAFAGMLFCVIYFFRGFGVTAWTHTLYDIFVLLND